MTRTKKIILGICALILLLLVGGHLVQNKLDVVEVNQDVSTSVDFESRPVDRPNSESAPGATAPASPGTESAARAPDFFDSRTRESPRFAPIPRLSQPTRLATEAPTRPAVQHHFTPTSEEPTSTFSIDVNTASYTASRDALFNGLLPHPSSVRPEEFLNFFSYDYDAPPTGQDFSIKIDALPSYFGSDPETPRHLMRVGIRGADIAVEDMKPSNLVFLVDISGSMGLDTRLPAAQIAMRTLVESLRPDDTVAIQTYASGTHTALNPTPVASKNKIIAAIDALHARGTTRGDAGIIHAYQLARDAFIEEGNNRVIIFSDGDFNVGPPGKDLAQLIRSYRDDHITVTTVAMGLGSQDETMELLARNTNGNYVYIDTLEEADRVFKERIVGTLQVLAADVKFQVEFNPDHVRRYRLLGYEKRRLRNEDFKNDQIDAAELGPGHTVTAFYEVEFADELPDDAELARVDIRYKKDLGAPGQHLSQRLTPAQVYATFEQAPAQLRFATAVASFAESLQIQPGSDPPPPFNEMLAVVARSAYKDDARQVEFANLITFAQELWTAY
ncbi:vWA domain-containing protein [Lujinxingia litoralis]|nr:von Willebrand factor type A domain-containing protein [Lujinxingia litoralis]